MRSPSLLGLEFLSGHEDWRRTTSAVILPSGTPATSCQVDTRSGWN